jgi:hypothetical protein
MRARVTTSDPDIKIIICCSFCGYESRATRAWKHSHANFQCSGCGETISLVTKTPRIMLDALAFWRRLSFLSWRRFVAAVCWRAIYPDSRSVVAAAQPARCAGAELRDLGRAKRHPVMRITEFSSLTG